MKKLSLLILLIPFIGYSQVPNILKDLTPGNTGSTIKGFSKLTNNDVIFSVTSPSATSGLWKTDGSTPGTINYKQGIITNTVLNNISNAFVSTTFIDFAGKKFFAATTPGYILWKTDGTLAGTDSIAVPNLMSANYFSIFNNVLYFVGETASEGKEIWRTDGTVNGTYMIKDIWPGANTGLLSAIKGFYAYNNEIYFVANDGVTGEELWKTDGTIVGTVLVKDINPGSNASNIFQIKVANNGLYFIANDGVTGSEPWFTAGTAATTNLVYDVNPGVNGSSASPAFFNLNNSYFFYNQKIIKSTGTTAGTSSVAVSSYPSSVFNALQLFNNKIFFVERINGTFTDTFNLKSVDLNLANLQVTKSIVFGHGSIPPNKAVFNQIANSKMIVTIWGTTNSDPNYMFISNGTAPGTKFFYQPCFSGNYVTGYDVAFDSINKKLYFPNSYKLNSNNVEPGYIDLQNDTLIQLSDLTAGNLSSYSFGPPAPWNIKLFKLNNKSYFIAKTPATGEEIYETDLTPGGTFLLKDIYPGNSSYLNPGVPNASNYSYGWLGGNGYNNSIVTPNNIYFVANDGVNGLELWSFINSPNSVNENKLTGLNLSLFPNPINESLNIKADIAISNVIFTDILGKKIKEAELANLTETTLNISEFKPGIYFVTINTSKGRVTKKIIKD